MYLNNWTATLTGTNGWLLCKASVSYIRMYLQIIPTGIMYVTE